eukprot:497709-Pelagomonas_calceolata.AAC.2
MGNELLHLLLLPLGFSVPLLLCPAEVYKTAVTHYFKGILLTSIEEKVTQLSKFESFKGARPGSIATAP